MRQTHIKVLNELLRNCKRSDRDISKFAGVSQPTVTRVRQRLIKKGIIKKCLAIPDYTKLGYPFGAITMCVISRESLMRVVSNGDFVLISAPLISLDNDTILITLHRSIDSYNKFLEKVKDVSLNPETTLFSTKGFEINPVRVPTKPFIALET